MSFKDPNYIPSQVFSGGVPVAKGFFTDEDGQRHAEAATDAFTANDIDARLGWAEKEPESTTTPATTAANGITFEDMCAAFSLTFQSVLGNPNSAKAVPLEVIGARLCAVFSVLDPSALHPSRSSIAAVFAEAEQTRGAGSKFFVKWKRELDVMANGFGRSATSRGNYRVAQLEALERGTHSSQTRKRREMTADEAALLDAVGA